MTTAQDIINGALKDIGVIASGEAASGSDASDALELLNQLIGQWQVTGLNVYALRDLSFPASGAVSYTIGAGGTIDAARPSQVIAAFWREGGADRPLTVINAFEDYQSIEDKSQTGSPDAIYYQPTYPLGNIYVYPLPTGGDVHLTIKESLQTFVDFSDAVSLPPEYLSALRFTLAELLCLSFGVQLRPELARQAAKARKVIKRQNVQIPALQMPEAITANHYEINVGH